MATEFNIGKLIGNSHVLPPLPPFPKDVPAKVQEVKAAQLDDKTKVLTGSFVVAADKVEQTVFGTPQIVPIKVKLRTESDFWLFPVETLVSIDIKNVLIKRNVAKKKVGIGTIKEYWTQDDYAITIQGLLTVPDSNEYPSDDLNQLTKYCTAKEALDVMCPLFEYHNITRIVIESCSLPFTKGMNNQNFTIQALSDTQWELLIKKQF